MSTFNSHSNFQHLLISDKKKKPFFTAHLCADVDVTRDGVRPATWHPQCPPLPSSPYHIRIHLFW